MKRSLYGHAVTVIYRGNELVLWDNQSNSASVLTALKNLRNKYKFAVALASDQQILSDSNLILVWKNEIQHKNNRKRIWLIRETTG